jgi:hypothetical protein
MNSTPSAAQGSAPTVESTVIHRIERWEVVGALGQEAEIDRQPSQRETGRPERDQQG